MEKKVVTKKVANVVADVATKFLKTDANSASSGFAYQPKAPKELVRFKKNK